MDNAAAIADYCDVDIQNAILKRIRNYRLPHGCFF
jgi:hypothetical protein